MEAAQLFSVIIAIVDIVFIISISLDVPKAVTRYGGGMIRTVVQDDKAASAQESAHSKKRAGTQRASRTRWSCENGAWLPAAEPKASDPRTLHPTAAAQPPRR